MPILYAGRRAPVSPTYPTYRYFKFRFFGIDEGDYLIIASIEMAATPGGSNFAAAHASSATGSAGTAPDAFTPSGSDFQASAWGEWVKIDLGSITTLAEVTINPSAVSNHYLMAPAAFALAGSNDNSTWTSIGIYPMATWAAGVSQSVAISDAVLTDSRAAARIWWLAGTGVATGVAAGPTSSGLIWGATQQATGGKAVGGTVRSGNVVANLYDGNTATVFMANAYLFGSAWFGPAIYGYLWPSGINLSQYSVIASGPGAPVGDQPSGWTVNWTSDGFNDHTTDTVTGQSGWTSAQVRTFSITP